MWKHYLWNFLSKGPASALILFALFCPAVLWGGNVAWFYALDSDKVALEASSAPPTRTITLQGGTVVSEYRVGPHKIVAAKMGSGCVSTAVTVARVLALNPVDRVISTGPAGGIGDLVKKGDWLRIGEVTAWQQGRAGEGGRIFSAEHAVKRVGTILTDWPAGEWQTMQEVKLVSGEVFVASSEKRGELANGFQAQIVEMNAFGLLAALEGTNVKILILRVVSDFANERAGEDFSAFLKTYKGEGGAMVADLIRKLPVGKNEPAAHEALRKLLEE
jgi:nucleoside phosphorylase